MKVYNKLRKEIIDKAISYGWDSEDLLSFILDNLFDVDVMRFILKQMDELTPMTYEV